MIYEPFALLFSLLFFIFLFLPAPPLHCCTVHASSPLFHLLVFLTSSNNPSPPLLKPPFFHVITHMCTEALTHNSHLSESRNPKEAILFSIAHVPSHTCEDNFLFDNDVQIKAKSFIFSFIFYFL